VFFIFRGLYFDFLLLSDFLLLRDSAASPSPILQPLPSFSKIEPQSCFFSNSSHGVTCFVNQVAGF
jgi:hypothetical protein